MGFSGSVRFRCVALRYSKISVSVLNCQVIECVDFFAKPSSKIQVKLYIIIYTFPVYNNLYIAPLSVVRLAYSLLTVVLLLFVKVN